MLLKHLSTGEWVIHYLSIGHKRKANDSNELVIRYVLDRDAMIGAVPSYEEPYIKVPRVLSMD